MPRKQPRLYSRSQFARYAEVTPAAITKACKDGNGLADACLGDRVDVDHRAAVAYLKAHGKAPVPKPKKPPAKKKGAKRAAQDDQFDTDDPVAVARLDHGVLSQMTIQEVIDTFGSRRGVRDWLEALKLIEAIRKTRLDNDETEGELISRELVRTHVFGAIEALHQQLLADLPRTLVTRLYASARSEEPQEEVERIVCQLISKQLKTVKTRTERVIRNA